MVAGQALTNETDLVRLDVHGVLSVSGNYR